MKDLEANADFLRRSVGAVHLMISRDDINELDGDWASGDLPFRLKKYLLEKLLPTNRITVTTWIHDPSKWVVLIDGWNCSNVGGFKDKKDAEIYADGLRYRFGRMVSNE